MAPFKADIHTYIHTSAVNDEALHTFEAVDFVIMGRVELTPFDKLVAYQTPLLFDTGPTPYIYEYYLKGN